MSLTSNVVYGFCPLPSHPKSLTFSVTLKSAVANFRTTDACTCSKFKGRSKRGNQEGHRRAWWHPGHFRPSASDLLCSFLVGVLSPKSTPEKVGKLFRSSTYMPETRVFRCSIPLGADPRGKQQVKPGRGLEVGTGGGRKSIHTYAIRKA